MCAKPAIDPIEPVKRTLKDTFAKSIDMSDVTSGQEDHLLSRALAAAYILQISGLQPDAAAAHITDGGDDEGIDAIYCDLINRRLHLVQSKWRKNPSKGIALSEWTRFRDGCKKLLQPDAHKFGAKIQQFIPDIQTILKDINCQIRMCTITTGSDVLSKEIMSDANSFLKENNQFDEDEDTIKYEHKGIKFVRELIRTLGRRSIIDLEVLVRHWGIISDPYTAYYGSVCASDIAAWHKEHGDSLFAENVRLFLDETSVNKAIIQSLKAKPKEFWYNNNGITLICDEIKKQAMGGASRDSGVFLIKRVSVVNGAQTVGAIRKAADEVDVADAYVPVRVISLKDTPDEFSVEVTRNTNTQNSLSAIDFASLDLNQERIRRELYPLGIRYSYRRGETGSTESEKILELRSATIALACALPDLRLAVAAKRNISSLWEDHRREPYTLLFNEDLSSATLLAKVKVLRLVDDHLSKQEESLTGKERLMAVHGNRFILHCVFSKATKEKFDYASDLGVEHWVKNSAAKIFLETRQYILSQFPESYPGNLFKNTEKQLEIKNNLIAKGIL